MRRSSPGHKIFLFALFVAASIAQLAISLHYAGVPIAAFQSQATPNTFARPGGALLQEMAVASLTVAGLLVLTCLGSRLIQRESRSRDKPSRFSNPALMAIALALLMGALAHGWILSQRFAALTPLEARIKAVGPFMLDVLTATFILFCILVEISLLFQTIAVPGGEKTKTGEATLSLIRPAAFLFVFGLDLSLSFIPLYMERIYRPMPGLSKELVMGLPISAEFICTGIAIYLSGIWVDRRGWRQPFFWGAVLGGAGNLLAGTAVEPLQLILARGISGAGFGFMLIAAQFLVVSNGKGKSMGFGLATLFAGIYAGNLCGNVLGAILADIFGYGWVFIAGSLVYPGVLAIGRFIPGHLVNTAPSAPHQTATQGTAASGVFTGFFSDRVVLALIFFCAFPSSIVIVGFFHYFVPIHLHDLGVSQPGIGRMMMVYSLCLMYLGPRIGKLVDDSSDNRQLVFFGCVLGSAAFLSFAALEGLWAIFASIVLLGLSTCFILPSQTAFLLAQPASERLGVGKALGIYRAASRVGQGVGPLIFGAFFAGQGGGSDLLTVGGIYLIVSLLFFAVTARREQSQEAHP